MLFRTEIEALRPGFGIDYRNRVLAVGSCFAENMASKLRIARFRVESNPFGVMFNPVSVAGCLDRLISGELFTADDLSQAGGLWISYAHHGSFSSPSAEETLERVNRAVGVGSQALREADRLIVTLGTAWVYERQGRVVANCHKAPAGEFTRRRLSVDEVAEALSGVFGRLPGREIILTVSPVRHIKDGLAENSISKATLIMAAHRLSAENPAVHYFPSYEIMVDDLRDYRFYNRDMVHPSLMAVDYIWEKFCTATMNPATRLLVAEMEQIAAAVAHRPINPCSEGHAAFRRTMAARCRSAAEANPEIDLSRDTAYFESEYE